MTLRLRPLEASLRADFLAVLDRGSAESGPCRCTAYHIRGYEKEGPACRDRMFAEGRSDGYLLYEDGRPVGWCQCGPWESFAMLASKPAPQQGAWAITCMVLAPEAKGRGLAHALLREVLADLRRRGVPYVTAMGHRLGPTYSSPLPELPESVCVKAGMVLEKDDPECPRYGLKLA
jgi:GNAT superfamily N-acetyltransferase